MDIFWCLMLALFPMLIGHTFFNWAMGHIQARVVSVSILGEPIGSSLLGLGIFGELPSSSTWWAAPFILLGVYLTANEAAEEEE